MPADHIPTVYPAADPAGLPIARPARRPEPQLDRPLRRWRRPPPARGMLVSLFAYGAVLWSLIGFVASIVARADRFADVPRPVLRDRMLLEGLAVGLFDAAVVGVAVLIAGRPKPRPAAADPVTVWAVAVPLLAVMLGANIGYSLGLRWVARYVFRVDPDADDLEVGIDQGVLAVLAVCVQPAVVEEVLFRYLMLGHLRAFIGKHGAVFLSSFFFMCAHLGQVGGWPILFVLGVGLGYARVGSGGLALPILLHFLHNLVVIWVGPMLM